MVVLSPKLVRIWMVTSTVWAYDSSTQPHQHWALIKKNIFSLRWLTSIILISLDRIKYERFLKWLFTLHTTLSMGSLFYRFVHFIYSSLFCMCKFGCKSSPSEEWGFIYSGTRILNHGKHSELPVRSSQGGRGSHTDQDSHTLSSPSSAHPWLG